MLAVLGMELLKERLDTKETIETLSRKLEAALKADKILKHDGGECINY